MITRPLDLASRLTPPPRGWDPLFYVNVGLLALFFTFFGSRFILTPVVALTALPDAATENVRTTHFITVLALGKIYADRGVLEMDQLPEWLQGQAQKWSQGQTRTTEHPSLLVRADKDVTMTKLTQIVDAARQAGFEVFLAVDRPATK